MNLAHTQRLAVWAEHGEPKGYGGSDLMREDVQATLAEVERMAELLYAQLAATPHPPQGSAEAQSVFDELITFEETCEKRPTFGDAVAIALAAKQRAAGLPGAAGEGGERSEAQTTRKCLYCERDMLYGSECTSAAQAGQCDMAPSRAAGLRGDEAQEGGK